MRPAISDSLISGQPLNLLYWNAKALPAVPALRLASLAVQATGSVRLQVTGRPPTTSASLFFAPDEQPYRLSGSAAAAAVRRKSRRPRLCAFIWDGPVDRTRGMSTRQRIRGRNSLRL